MFKNKSMTDEIADSMDAYLAEAKAVSKTIKVAAAQAPAIDLKKEAALSQLTKVADYLNSAAEILDNAGMGDEAEIVTAVIELLANKEGNVDLRALIQSSKMESVQLEKNLLETGTPFKFDGNDADDGEVSKESDSSDSNDASDGEEVLRAPGKEELEMNDEDLGELERKLDQDFEDTE
jgi:hypothetical protein